MINSLVRRGGANARKEGVRKGDRKNGVPAGRQEGKRDTGCWVCVAALLINDCFVALPREVGALLQPPLGPAGIILPTREGYSQELKQLVRGIGRIFN